MIFIETQRLLLRNLTPRDADVMFDYRNHPLCSRCQRGQAKNYEGIARIISRHEVDDLSVQNYFMAAVTLKDTNEMIGEITVMPNGNTISIGYTISYRAFVNEEMHKKGLKKCITLSAPFLCYSSIKHCKIQSLPVML